MRDSGVECLSFDTLQQFSYADDGKDWTCASTRRTTTAPSTIYFPPEGDDGIIRGPAAGTSSSAPPTAAAASVREASVPPPAAPTATRRRESSSVILRRLLRLCRSREQSAVVRHAQVMRRHDQLERDMRFLRNRVTEIESRLPPADYD